MCHPVVKIAVAAAIAASAPGGALAQDAREILAPKGKLRVGAYLGSPLSMVKDSKTGEIHGLSVDLGKELAKRLDVPFEHVSYQRVADVLAGMKAGDVDFTVSNATSARAVDVNFSQPLISLELGYLVPSDSPIATISDVDKPGLRVCEAVKCRTDVLLVSDPILMYPPIMKERDDDQKHCQWPERQGGLLEGYGGR
jgi:polar amino acid transport system substrate-binding protein